VHSRRKGRSRNITNDKNRHKKERDKYKSSKDWKRSKRKGQSSASRKKENKCDRIIKNKWKSTSLTSKRNWNQKKIT